MHLIRLKKLEALYSENPNDCFVLFALAKEYELNNNITEAIQHLEKLIVINKDYVGAYLHLGKIYEKMNEINKALNIYENGILIARHINDTHALSELKTAKINLEMEY